MSEWKVVTIDQVANIKSGKRLPNGHTLVQENTMLPYVRLVDVTDGIISKDNLMFLQADTQRLISRYIVKKGDVCLAIVGHTIGMVFQVDDFFHGANLTENAARLTDFDDKILPQFLYYYLISKTGQQEIISRKVGSAQGKLPLYNIRSLPINLPGLTEQKAIAYNLGTLDDKIALNRQMNQTLEGMAQALFKSWFVDFDPVMDNALAAGNPIPDELLVMAEKRQLVPDSKKLLAKSPDFAAKFPSSFVFNETLGKWIPEGWGDILVQNILKRLKVSNTYKKDQVFEFGTVPVYEQGSGILLGYHENEPDVIASINDPAFIFGDHTCVMKLGTSPFSISANVIVLKGSTRNTIWTYFGLQGVQSFEEYRRHWMELIVKSIILVPVELCDSFVERIKPLIQKQFENQKQTETLTQLRDRLLPELISGKVRVKEEILNDNF